jgi:hypothetical protein
LASSGGHSPWRHPIGVYSLQENRFATVDDLIGSPILSEEFEFTGPHILTARTWGEEGQPGPVDEVLGRPTITIPIDLEEAFEKLRQDELRQHDTDKRRPDGWPAWVSPLPADPPPEPEHHIY